MGRSPSPTCGRMRDRESPTSLNRTLSNNRLELLTLTRLVRLEGIGSPVMKLAC